MNQRTIARPVRAAGKGLHTGKTGSIEIRPADAGQGIVFFRGTRAVARLGDPAILGAASVRCSAVGEGADRILTIEHLAAAVAGLGVTNLRVGVEGPELPALDGSSAGFVELIRQAGVVDQAEPADAWRVTEPIVCSEKGRSVAIFPADRLSVQYVLDYDFPGLRAQTVEYDGSAEAFERQIAPARTFCTEDEVNAIRAAGLGLGADASNTLVVDAAGRWTAQSRFPDEPARHKILDLVGDLALTGFPVVGRVVGIRSGHELNRRLAAEIIKQRNAMQMDIHAIKKVLPHREPFLFLDRVIERTDKTLVATKKLTGQEDFFKGHFPGQPVMPGVLMVEAMAQAGGILLLGKPENHGKIAYLASVTEARFRRVVVPGEELRFEVEALRVKSRVGVMKGVAKVGDEVACEAEIMFSLGSS